MNQLISDTLPHTAVALEMVTFQQSGPKAGKLYSALQHWQN
jgi:hypothetical protein